MADIASHLDSNAFTVPGADALNTSLSKAGTDAGNIQYNWTNVNNLLGDMATQQGKASARAQGQGLTAGNEARMNQQDLGASAGDPASLGTALMKLGSKQSAGQAAQVAGAQSSQQLEAAQQSTELGQQQAQVRLQQFKAEMQLQNQQFQMQNAVKQSQNGLQSAQLQMQNMFNEQTSRAKNAQEMGDTQIQHDNFAQTMMYLGSTISAASAAASAGAAARRQPSATSTGSNGGDLKYAYGGGSTGETPTYGGITSTGGTGHWGATPVTGTSAVGDFYSSSSGNA